MRGEEEECMQGFWYDYLKGRDHWKDLEVHGRFDCPRRPLCRYGTSNIATGLFHSSQITLTILLVFLYPPKSICYF
jgi:hypothetical protein